MNAPLKIVECESGIEAAYADGAVIRLTLHGTSECTLCGVVNCDHFRAAVPIYAAWKWRYAEKMREAWGPTLYRAAGVDPRIFFPPQALYDAALDSGAPESMDVLGGELWMFPDGAYLATIAAHPDGSTRCSLCHSRDCRHWATVREIMAEVATLEAT